MVLHVKFEFHSNRDLLTYFTAKNRSKSFICIHGLKNHIEASDLVHSYIVSVLYPTDFRHGWAIFGPLAAKNTWKGVLLELPASEKFFRTFLVHVVRYQFEIWHIHLVGGVKRQVRVSFQSGHLTYFTAKNRSKSFICIHGFKNYIEASDLVHTQIVSVLTPTDFMFLA